MTNALVGEFFIPVQRIAAFSFQDCLIEQFSATIEKILEDPRHENRLRSGTAGIHAMIVLRGMDEVPELPVFKPKEKE